MKKIKILLFPLLISLALSSCAFPISSGKKEGKKEKTGEEGTVIYQLNAEKTSLRSKPYSLTGDNMEEEAGRMLRDLSSKKADGEYQGPLPEGVGVNGISYLKGKGTLTVSFDRSYLNLKGTDETMTRTAVAKSLLSLPRVRTVDFQVDHSTLTDGAGNVIGSMDNKSFVMAMAGKEVPKQEADLTLYYPDPSGEMLVKEKRTTTYNSNIPLGRVVLTCLQEKPKTKGAHPAFPSSAQVLSVTVADGVCYVNLDSGFLDRDQEVTERASVYAVVNSLTEMKGVSRVQLSIDGKNLTLSDPEDPDQEQKAGALYDRDDSLVIPSDETEE